MTSPALRFALPLALALLFGAGRAGAQAAGGFAIDRFEPAERGSDWFVADSLDFRGHGRVLVGSTGDWAHKPLVVYDDSGAEQAPLLRNQFFAHFGTSLLLWQCARLGLNLPISIQQSGDAATLAGTTYVVRSGTRALGDLRTSIDYRLFGAYRERLTLAAGLQAFFPTGDPAALAGDQQVRFGPRLLLAGVSNATEYAARLSLIRRSDRGRFAGALTGSELQFVAALGMRVAEQRAVVGAEFYGSTVVDDGAAFLAGPSTPLELLVGGHFKPTPDVRVGAGLGAGLTRGFGAPSFRGVVSLEWAPDPDRPARPERRAPRPAETEDLGPADRDGDGLNDVEDACPDVRGVWNKDGRRSGCSLADRDKDSVPDEEDACPDERGKRTGKRGSNGCPPPKDRDKDGFLDEQDACPDVPGDAHGEPKTVGCPAARIEGGAIRILERVEFEMSSDKLRPESDRVLKAVLDLLNRHPELTKIVVEGHTDNRGPMARNLRLSEQRARAVVRWLVQHGIDGARLGSKGFGAERPVDSNETERGRQSNRRVEFRIVENEGKATKGSPSDPGF